MDKARPLLQMSGSHKHVPGMHALDDVRLEVYAGECLGRRGAAGGHDDEEWVLVLVGWRWEAWRERDAQERQERQTYPVRLEGGMA